MKYLNRVNKPGRGGFIAVFLSCLLLTGCGGGGDPASVDDEGIVGTGIQLKGTVSSDNRLAANQLELKSSDGVKSEIAVGANGRYESGIAGQSPHLIRADLGNGSFQYSIGFASGDQITQNLHSYTDAATRNWFSIQGLNIDSEFESGNPLSSLPTEIQYNETVSVLASIVAPVQEDYGLAGVDIQTADFSADGSGLDQYLINNPVIVNNGQITIIVNNPGNTVQSVATSNLSLGTDLTVADSESPSTPESLRALQASPNEAVVVWQPSMDNIGVTSYEVTRDGVVVDVTPYPVFTDTELSPGTTYVYSVVALDAAGNASLATPVASLTLSIELDTVAPPPPLSVQLDASLNFIGVTWQHPDISDVALFEVLRGVGTAAPTNLTSVPSTFITDTNLLSGTQYCYQVVAVDSAGNQSEASQVSCAITSGNSVVTEEVVTPLPVDPTDTTGFPISTDCTTELTTTNIDEDTTIPAGCYLVNENITVDDANLTIAPNTVLSFSSGTAVLVSDDASLTADGTAQAPILFTAQEPIPGFWRGISFNFTNSTSNILNNVIVEYGGGLGSNIELNATSGSPTRISITNSTIRNSASSGLIIDDGTFLTFTNNTVTANDFPAEVYIDVVTGLGVGSRFSGNTSDIIQITGNRLTIAGTWEDQSVPYRLDSVTLDEALVIRPGVTLEFISNGRMNVSDDGSLEAVGSATAPITFTGVEKTRGFWHGLLFSFSGSTNNRLENVILEYAGTSTNSDAILELNSIGTSVVRLAVNNLTIRESLGDGFHIAENTILSQFDNVTSTSNARAGLIDAQVVGSLGTGLNLTGNDEDVIFVETGGINKNESWDDHGVPYLAETFSIDDTNLILNPGVELLMESGSTITVRSEASLTVMGSATNPVLFSGAEPLPGFWRGINFSFSNSTNNSIDNAVIRHGGASEGNVNLSCVGTSITRLSISNTLIADSAALGISTNDSCILNLDNTVTFSNNADGDL